MNLNPDMIEYYESAFKPSQLALWITGARPFRTHCRPLIYSSFIILAVQITLTPLSFVYEQITLVGSVDILLAEYTSIHTVMRLATLVHYEAELQKMLGDMENLWPLTGEPALQKILNYWNSFQKVFLIAMILNVAGLCTHGHVTGEYALHFYGPDIVPARLFRIVGVDAYLFFLVCCSIGFDLHCTTLMIILTIQYKLLNKRLQNCFSNNNDGKELGRSVEMFLEQNNLLKRIIHSFNKILGPMLLIYTSLVVIIIGMVMYMIYERNENPLDFVKYLFILYSYAVQIFVEFIVPGQLLTDEINRTFDEIYSTNWYECRLPVQKSLLMVLTRKQEKAVLTASWKLVDLNFTTCTRMFRACYSVFTFLVHMKNFKAKDE